MIHAESATATLLQKENQQACCASQKPQERCHVQPEKHNQHKHHGHHGHHDHQGMAHEAKSLNQTAFMATLHCLTGCTIGEVLGMVIGTALGWSNWPTVALAVALAFLFGYGMTLWPLRRAGMAWGTALGLAFASDTLSMATMELVDNAIMLVIPGAMDAGLSDPLFWGSLVVSLILAGAAAFPVNRWLITRGKGHALVHAHHGC
jgi:cation transport ATPase